MDAGHSNLSILLAANPDYPISVTFCCFDERTREVYEEYLIQSN